MLEFHIATERDSMTLVPMMAAFYAHFGEAFDAQRTERALLTLLATPAIGRVWLINLDSATIGYVVVSHFFSLEYGGTVALLDELYIDAPYRGTSVGTQAIAHVEAYAHTNAMVAVGLEVDHTNPAARRLYRRVGFVSVAREVMVKLLQ